MDQATVPLTRLTAAVLVALLIGAPPPLHAQSAGTPSNAPAAATPAATAPAAGMTQAQVRRIDRSTSKITLKHEEIVSLAMPPMTMVFQVQDPAWLEGLAVGTQVLFRAEKIGGAYVVTALEVTK